MKWILFLKSIPIFSILFCTFFVCKMLGYTDISWWWSVLLIALCFKDAIRFEINNVYSVKTPTPMPLRKDDL
jgi:hypothetical protein